MKRRKETKKRKLKKSSLYLAVICGIIILLIIGVGVIVILNVDKDTGTDNDKEVEKIDQMENYDEYYLEQNATEYYKELYNELKEVLNSDEVNEEEYAKAVSKLFVTDLLTLDNKITSSDIGGTMFVYNDFRNDFVNIAKNSLYSNVKSNIYGDRNQQLPVVSYVEINEIHKSTFSYQGNTHESYNVILNISYEEELGYPNKYSLVLIKNDKYLQVVFAE